MLKGVRYKAGQTRFYNDRERGVYTLDPLDPDDALYIGDWRIESNILYHRHPDECGYGLTGYGVQEYDVNDRVCWKCEARCPDTIWFAHKLQQLP